MWVGGQSHGTGTAWGLSSYSRSSLVFHQAVLGLPGLHGYEVRLSLVLSLTLMIFEGYRNHDKKKSHKYDSSRSRLRKKMGGREKEAGGGTRRGGGRLTSQRPSRSHSDDEEDEGVPASYHTVSLQVSQDVSTSALFPPLPHVGLSQTSQSSRPCRPCRP